MISILQQLTVAHALAVCGNYIILAWHAYHDCVHVQIIHIFSCITASIVQYFVGIRPHIMVANALP